MIHIIAIILFLFLIFIAKKSFYIDFNVKKEKIKNGKINIKNINNFNKKQKEQKLKEKNNKLDYIKIRYFTIILYDSIIMHIKYMIRKKKFFYDKEAKEKENNYTKGIMYELKIHLLYEDNNYKVFPNGLIKKYKDKGIDLIAKKNNEIILIQCKNYKYPPKMNLITKFMNDCENFIKENQELCKNKIIHKNFITSCKDKDYKVIKFLEENKNPINYLIIE